MIVLDSSILIDFFRKKRKERSAFFKLTEDHSSFSISVITYFGILVGCTDEVQDYWRELDDCVDVAVAIDRDLRQRNKRLELPDLLIASTAVAHDLPLATLNRRHFERIKSLRILSEAD
ncbi:MAG TPA: type II toxin-antitoxin system VapC family toxin [Pyrinomonadaceae bacterium]|nr:type II toxin-antitoxin system VapC family toxin [Pyrinomonadaceae bacterium]